ncbi:hypothetical protein C0Q70_07453 [Pomacea canaliculata]|uniref:G-protein coupled receptors family 1 profile domain-containing protein n=1 Tax=Pomacea canaliculata TaxID=400727 RepID=A0A2T7PF43_POMCA|nr:hypothetical protein C0Q70_07453 [Pomacea canaliculata]
MTSTLSFDGYWPMTTDTYYQQIPALLQHAQSVVSYISLFVNVVKIAAFTQTSMRNGPSGTFMLTISVSHFIWIVLGVINSIVERVITGTRKKTKPGMNGSKIVVYGYTDWYFRNKTSSDAFSAAGKILFVFVPLVWVSIFNALVVCFLRLHSDDRKAIKSTVDEEVASRRDRQMTLTILACTFGYVIFILPVAIHLIAFAVVPEYNFAGRWANLIVLITKVQDIACRQKITAAKMQADLKAGSKYQQKNILRLTKRK